MHEPFSLLLAVYDGDQPDFLRRAFRSAVHDQTLRPDQVVIVRDGPVREELAQCLAELTAASPVPVTLVPLEHNRGLGPALDSGLAASKFDVVARMDADDVAMPNRFEVERASPPPTRPASSSTPACTTRSTTRPWCTGAAPCSPPAATATCP
jgi:glycosyltransferase involved in cell wall biosynthesis